MNGEGFGKIFKKGGPKPRSELLHTLFTEARSFGGTLAGLELGVALTDDVEGALALDDLAVFVAALHGE